MMQNGNAVVETSNTDENEAAALQATAEVERRVNLEMSRKAALSRYLASQVADSEPGMHIWNAMNNRHMNIMARNKRWAEIEQLLRRRDRLIESNIAALMHARSKDGRLSNVPNILRAAWERGRVYKKNILES